MWNSVCKLSYYLNKDLSKRFLLCHSLRWNGFFLCFCFIQTFLLLFINGILTSISQFASNSWPSTSYCKLTFCQSSLTSCFFSSCSSLTSFFSTALWITLSRWRNRCSNSANQKTEDLEQIFVMGETDGVAVTTRNISHRGSLLMNWFWQAIKN